MSTLYGYVRNIVVDGDTCTVENPNLYYKHLGDIHEVHVEIDNINDDLINLLLCFSKPMTKTKTSIAVLDRVISVQGLRNLSDLLYDVDLVDNQDADSQLADIKDQCDAIIDLAGYDYKNAFFEFAISKI
jgi:hypothetical protein